MPKMSTALLKRFDAIDGAYSKVTLRESTGDAAVTVDKYEKAVIIQVHELKKLPEKVKGVRLGDEGRLKFVVHERNNWNVEREGQLALVHPKQGKSELRLYMHRTEGFFGEPDDMFYIFHRGKKGPLHVGFMSPADWSRVEGDRDDAFDTEEEEYQRAVFSAEAGLPATYLGTRYPRNAAAALEALSAAGYRCEIDPDHDTFISERTGKPYVEAHHLMPVSRQGEVAGNLDTPSNIVSVCPNCHRKLHLGRKADRLVLVGGLFAKRMAALKRDGLEFDAEQLLKAYGLM
jgi:5-methylcytosine-specific restriction protein A